MEAEGVLPVRYYMMVRTQTNEEMDELLPYYRAVAEGNDFLTIRSIKRQMDGALGSHGAWLLEPYIDLPDTDGLVLETVEDIERTAEIAVKHGFQVNVHAIGDRANRETLDIFERVWKAAGVDGKDLRWRIEHAQHLDPADVPRFGEMGVIAAMQGVHATSDGPWIPSRLGEERSRITSYPWRDLLDTGAVIGNGTDVPVERIDPIASYYSSVSRMTNEGKRFNPEHVMTREEAIQTYTINNAIAAFEEDIKGTLTPGKYADIVVLSQDLLTVEEEKIPETTVDLTIVGGEIKYKREM
jgi:predicted amidohydrolase YtcJ